MWAKFNTNLTKSKLAAYKNNDLRHFVQITTHNVYFHVSVHDLMRVNIE